MAYINKFKDVEVELPSIKGGNMNGDFKMVAFKGVEFPQGSGKVFKFAGTERVVMDWKSNLITNNGLDFYGGTGSNAMGYFHVGTGNTPPANTDSALEAFVAATAVWSSSSWVVSAQSTPPYYATIEMRYRFSPGFGGGNITLNECGVGTSATSTSLTARSLTVDANGDPSSVSVLNDEYLDCYYRRRLYPAHIVEATGVPTDDSGTVLIDGVSYGYTIRPAAVTYGGGLFVSTSAGWATQIHQGLKDEIGYGAEGGDDALFYLGNTTLGAVTGYPSGANGYQRIDTAGYGGYVAGTYNKELWYQAQLSEANHANGIGGMLLKTSHGAYQIVFDTNIPKVYGQVFTYYHSFSWARKNPPWAT